LEIASNAPSGGNIQPWKVYVVTGSTKEKLIKKALNNFDNGVQEKIEYDIYPNPLDGEYKRRRSECARDMYTALSIEQDDIELRLSQIRENFKFFGAPVGMIVTIDKAFAENGWGHVGMFIQNICLSAVERGMGTCLQESWSIYPETVKDILNIPDNEVVWCGVALGYPNKDHPINNYRTSRVSIEKFVTFIE
jgi:nitroreductase